MSSLLLAATAFGVAALLVTAGLRAWRGWLDFKRFEITQRREARAEIPDLAPGVRIEMANLKERLRRLEAIAQGVDL